MPGFAFAMPVVSGKEELDRNTLEEIAGPRLAEHEAAMRDAGISRHAAWHQQTPDVHPRLGLYGSAWRGD
jgi:hypothetical protein